MKTTKHAVIIGATSGIGKCLAELLVKDGYTVVITGRRKQLLDELWQIEPSSYIPMIQDVTELDKIPSFFDEIKSKLKTIDLIVYSSGTGGANISLEWDKEFPTLQTNVMAATMVFGLAYNLFHEQGFGHLVAITSIASIRGNRHVPAYFASKAFQASYLESLWMKGQRSKAEIYVTDIQPGFVDTDMAIGDTFWMATVEKATKQIYGAIKKRKKKAYITKRWRLVAWVLRAVPSRLLTRFS